MTEKTTRCADCVSWGTESCSEQAPECVPADWPGCEHYFAAEDANHPYVCNCDEEMKARGTVCGSCQGNALVADLRAKLERERMRLAACGVVALADTPVSAAEARNMHPDYMSASCVDVARRVDECMALRAENNRLRSILREAISRRAMQHTGPSIGGKCTEACVLCEARAALADNGKAKP
jgi:hypothetical protein